MPYPRSKNGRTTMGFRQGLVDLHQSAAFTLIEMLVVLSIVGIVVAISAPHFSKGSKRLEADAATRLILSGLKKAQSTAIFNNRETLFQLDLKNHVFWVGTDTPTEIPKSLSLTLLTALDEVVTQDIGAIRFFPDGTSTGGAIDISHASSNPVRRRVTINWLTGRLDLS